MAFSLISRSRLRDSCAAADTTAKPTPRMSRPTRAGLLLVLLSTPALAQTQDFVLTLPPGWTLETARYAAGVTHQRASKQTSDGQPLMVMELTSAQLPIGGPIDLHNLLTAMRNKATESLAQTGWHGQCSIPAKSSLGQLPSLQTTCTMTQSTGTTLTQTWVAALSGTTAYTLSYAGPLKGYAQTLPQMQEIQGNLNLDIH